MSITTPPGYHLSTSLPFPSAPQTFLLLPLSKHSLAKTAQILSDEGVSSPSTYAFTVRSLEVGKRDGVKESACLFLRFLREKKSLLKFMRGFRATNPLGRAFVLEGGRI